MMMVVVDGQGFSHGGMHAEIEEELEVAVGGEVVRFPIATDDLLTEDACLRARDLVLISLGSEFGRIRDDGSVARAGLRDGLDAFFEAPRGLFEAPALEGVVLRELGGEPIQRHGDVIAAARVQYLLVLGAGADVGGWEDAHGVVGAVSFGQAAAHGDEARVGDGDGAGAAGAAGGGASGGRGPGDEGGGDEVVGDGDECGIGCYGEVSIEEAGEGELVCS